MSDTETSTQLASPVHVTLEHPSRHRTVALDGSARDRARAPRGPPRCDTGVRSMATIAPWERLDGKIALVTGAGRGIGREEALAPRGRGRARHRQRRRRRRGRGRGRRDRAAGGTRPIANTDDVSTWAGAEAAVGAVVDAEGRLDILVNNAGILRDAMSFSMTEEQWDDVIRVHLKGHVACAHFAGVALAGAGQGRRGGRRPAASSTPRRESGLYGLVGQVNYAAAKAGIASMTIVLARELQQVRRDRQRDRAPGPHPHDRDGARRAASPEEGEFDEWDPANIAPVVAWLATDAAARRHRPGVRRQRRQGAPHERVAPRRPHRQRRPALDRRPTSRPRTAELFGDRELAAAAPWASASSGGPARPAMALQVDQLRWMAEHHRRRGRVRRPRARRATHVRASGTQTSNRLARGPGRRRRRARRPGRAPPRRATTCSGWIVAYAAIHKAGAVAVPTNTRLSARELGADPRPRRAASSAITSARAGPTLRRRPRSRRCAASSRSTATTGPTALAPTTTARSRSPSATTTWPTSCTRRARPGLPKGIAVRHRNAHMIPNGEPQWTGDAWIHGSPLFTFAGIAFVYNPMKMGMRGALPRPLRRRRVARRRRAASGRPCAFLVPAMAQLLLGHDRFDGADLSSLTLLSIGSAPLPPDAAPRDRPTGCPSAMVSNNYSMTEAGTAFTYMPPEELERRGRVGRHPDGAPRSASSTTTASRCRPARSARC